MLQRLRQYIIDSYNGLYKIVIEPSMPTRRTVAGILIGLLIGLIWGYGIAPTKYYDGQPFQLNATAREQWVTMTAAASARGYYTQDGLQQLLRAVENPGQTVQSAIAKSTSPTVQSDLQAIQDIANNTQGTPAPRPAGLISDLLGWLIPIILVTVLTPVLVVVWRMLIYPNIVAGLIHQFKMRTDKSYRDKRVQEQADRQRIKTAREAEKSLVVEADTELGEPVIQKLSIYTKGRSYDDSFAIENANDDFLGECGAAIAKTVGDNELAAVEVWLFDKEDFVRTLNKIFLSEHAFNDPAIRAELEPKVEDPSTDLVMISPSGQLILETDQLRVRATVKILDYGTGGGLPPNSFFESLQLEIAAWEKAGSGAAARPAPMPAAEPAGAMPAYSPPPQVSPAAPTQQYTPPPMPLPSQPAPQTDAPQRTPLTPPPLQRPPQQTPPLQMPPQQPPPQQGTPPGGGIRPLTPPPLQQPPQPQPRPQNPPEDDDPFGGTGDFTPLRRD